LWVDESNERSIPLTHGAIFDKAKSLFDDIKGKKGGDDTFRASKGWSANFKQQILIYNMKLTGEAVLLEEESVHCCSITAMFCRRRGIEQGK
jgi:hypothetical protein